MPDMHQLRVFAVSINDVRDIFGADTALAARLRAVAARRFAPPPRKQTMLDMIGPLFARDRSREVDSRLPLRSDVDALLAGGHIPQDRLSQCWDLLAVWLEDISAMTLELGLDDLDGTDFVLARAGVPSTFSLRSLTTRELGIPLYNLPGQRVGYSKHAHVVEAARHLRMAQESGTGCSGRTGEALARLLDVMEGISRKPDDALDLVVFSQQG